MLANEGFVSLAKPEIVQRERDKLTELRAAKNSLEARIKVLP